MEVLGVHMLSVYVEAVKTLFACVKDRKVSRSVPSRLQVWKFVASLS